MSAVQSKMDVEGSRFKSLVDLSLSELLEWKCPALVWNYIRMAVKQMKKWMK